MIHKITYLAGWTLTWYRYSYNALDFSLEELIGAKRFQRGARNFNNGKPRYSIEVANQNEWTIT